MADGRVVELIRQSHSESAAAAYQAFVPTDAHIQQMQDTGREVLNCFPTLPGGCAVMSALYGAILQERMKGAVVHVVAGSLAVNGTAVFGSGAGNIDWNKVFGNSNASWDGHCWVMCGDWIADISLFRTAYSNKSPPALAQYVRREFGEGRGLLITKSDQELRYEPHYVLTDAQITALGRGAVHLIENPPS